MSGLYLHIPFCKQACHYCNFHFSTSLRYKSEVIEAIAQELVLRQDYLTDKELDAVYFGGGTPSLLSETELELLFDRINTIYKVKPDAEITLEANPDDITPDNLARWRDSPINRLSIGLQSFSNADLTYMNRTHNATEAQQCLQLAHSYGFKNLTVDLIYGTPTMTDADWERNVRTVIDAGIPHLSCYALTVEPYTALHHQIRSKKVEAPEEEQSARQFELLMEWLEAAGYEHYEISNFALPGHRAVHNSNYWLSRPYLGVGPSAHSFNGHSRQWNVANNAIYMQTINSLEPDVSLQEAGLYQREELSPTDRYNEYILTGLRTAWGVNTDRMEAPFREHFIKNIHQYVDTNVAVQEKNIFCLTKKGRLIADKVSSDLFY
jgi:oxygen-independent coproporphyrinogen-3 oxidase